LLGSARENWFQPSSEPLKDELAIFFLGFGQQTPQLA